MRPQQQRPPTPSDPQPAIRERAATIVEYSLLMAALMLGLLLALEGFSGQAGDDLEQRGSHVGNPQALTPTS